MTDYELKEKLRYMGIEEEVIISQIKLFNELKNEYPDFPESKILEIAKHAHEKAEKNKGSVSTG